MAGEQLDLLRRDVGLNAQPVVLVFERGFPHPLEDRLERLEPFGEHRADWAEEFQVDLVQAVDAFRREDPRDLPEVGRHIVRALDPASVGLRREGGRESIDDRHVRYPEAHLPDDHPDDVLRFPRGRVAEQFRQQPNLPFLTSFPGFPRDRVEMLIHLRDRQRTRLQRLLPPRGDRLLRDEPEVPLLLPEAHDACVFEAGRMGEDPDHHLLCEAELDPFVVRVDPTLRQVHHPVEVFFRGVP